MASKHTDINVQLNIDRTRFNESDLHVPHSVTHSTLRIHSLFLEGSIHNIRQVVLIFSACFVCLCFFHSSNVYI